MPPRKPFPTGSCASETFVSAGFALIRSVSNPLLRMTDSLRMPFVVFALLVGFAAGFLVGCGSGEGSPSDADETRHEDVRGRFLGTASDGRDAVLHHEAIPGVMPPMVMALPLADASKVDPIAKDAPVQFDLVIQGSEIRVENLSALPDSTTLQLPVPQDPDTTTVPDTVTAASAP